MLYSCALCGKEYRSSKAHERHLNSRSHLLKASQEPNASVAGITIVKPLPERVPRRAPSAIEEDEDDDEEEEWVEVDPSEMELADESTSNMQEDEQSSKSDDDMADLQELDISSCVMCDLKHDTIEDMQLAVNLGLPCAANLVVQRFQKLFMQTKCKESDELDAESPQGLLRTPETVAKFQAWAKPDFLQDMSNAMPLILEIVNLKPNLATNSAESDDDSIEKILEKKATACKLLLRYVDEFKEDFLPWIDQAASALVPLLWFCSCKEVQRAAIAALPKLLLSAKMAIEKGESQGRNESYVTKLSHSIIPNLVKAAIEEPETELRASMVDSLNECMQIAVSGANLRVEIVVAIFGPLPVEAFLNLRNALNVLQKENQVESDAYQIASSALMKVIQWHGDSIRSYELELNKSRRASWDLYDNWIFCKICLEEMERGYTFPKAFEEEDFNKMFFTRTGKVFRPDQFLNKWKGLKKMYNNGELLHMTKDSKDNNPTKQVKDFITQYPLLVEVPGLFGLVIELFKNCDNKIESCDGRDVVSEQAKVDPPTRNSHSSCLDENSIINTLEDKIKLLELSNAEKQRCLEDMEARLAEKERMLNEAELLRKKLHNQMMDLKGHMRVFCRVRPLFGNAENMVSYPKSLEHAGRGIQLMRKDKNVLYTYDKVFDHTASQEAIFKDISELVQSAMDGYKVTIFSYGQTGSGKTYTMIGKPGADQKGIIPRALEEIFRYKRTWEDNGWTFDVKASMFQIYNEKLFDLLDMSSNKHCDIYTDRPGNAVLSNIEERLICNEADAAYLFEEASKHRFVDKTQMNEESSRSHFVFKLMISGHNKQLGQKVEGVLQMIDLAGSETASKTDEIPDKRKNETKNINMSLLALGNLFEAIGRGNFLPYRSSKLTHLLQNFFVGDCKILMFVNINPEPSSMNSTLSSLDFAAKVHNCKIQRQAENHATQHQELDDGHLATTPNISKRVFRKKGTASKHRGVQIGTSIKLPVSRRPESCFSYCR